MGIHWTDKRIDLLKKLAADGLSCSQIAGEIGQGLSRNAIIGKLHRLGVTLRVRSKKPEREPRGRNGHIARKINGRSGYSLARRELAAPYYAENPQPIELPPDTSPDACTLLKLREESCRYPIGDPADEAFRFCGSPRFGDRPYCARHCRIVYRPTKETA